ncbi:hypothetical protein BDZ91DRAFT_784547 [Kalaharituber pfeilii]|nr:hypothetical protein BDZ91DRAFT_784547 [Kalaharituber pfeilii]
MAKSRMRKKPRRSLTKVATRWRKENAQRAAAKKGGKTEEKEEKEEKRSGEEGRRGSGLLPPPREPPSARDSLHVLLQVGSQTGNIHPADDVGVKSGVCLLLTEIKSCAEQSNKRARTRMFLILLILQHFSDAFNAGTSISWYFLSIKLLLREGKSDSKNSKWTARGGPWIACPESLNAEFFYLYLNCRFVQTPVLLYSTSPDVVKLHKTNPHTQSHQYNSGSLDSSYAASGEQASRES